MSDIVPTVAEIKAANAVEELLGNAVRDNTGHFLGVFAGVSRNDIGRVIAEHTRPRAEAAEAKVKELERLTAALRQIWIDDYESVHWSPHMDAAAKSKLHQDAEAAFEKWKANQQKETP